MLATGFYDGAVRIWRKHGELTATLTCHVGPIFAVKWNPTGEYIASGGIDSTTIIWKAETGELLQRFSHHSEPILNLDWHSDATFSSCGTDKDIHVGVLGLRTKEPLHTFRGHTVTILRYQPSL